MHDSVDLFSCTFSLCTLAATNYKTAFFHLNFCGSITCKTNVCFGVYGVSGALKFT